MKSLSAVVFWVMVALAGLLGYAAWAWRELHVPVVHSAYTLAVARGESLDTALSALLREKIINNALSLKLYVKVMRRDFVLKAGNYNIPSPVTAVEVIDILQKGGEFTKLTVVEGWNLFDIAAALSRLPGLHLSEKQALNILKDTHAIRDLDPFATSLDGYLFPDTYFVVPDSTADELVKEMVRRFRQIWKDNLQAKAVARRLSIHQVVTRASIIETEAKLNAERPLVASVIENRLRRNMFLSMDSTVVYASKLAGAWRNDGKVYLSDVNRRSPYNTRLNRGLPPGPVGSPGLDSLLAAVEPAETQYIYYVRNPSRNDGAHSFYADAAEFERGVQVLREWERQQHVR